MALDSMKEIFDRMEQEGKPFWEIVLETDMDERQVTRNQSMAKMLITWQAMADAADSYTGRRKSASEPLAECISISNCIYIQISCTHVLMNLFYNIFRMCINYHISSYLQSFSHPGFMMSPKQNEFCT